MARNIKLTMEYLGTNYYGFQKQPNDLTVQGELEKALKILLKDDVKTTGASRTDAGVHALFQVVNFMTASLIPLSKLKRSLNGLLPRDIAISKAEDASPDFHARRSATSKEYKYYILNRPFPSPFFSNFSYWFPPQLKIKLMQEAAQFFKGTHDFSAFCIHSPDKKSYVRTILSIRVEKTNVPVKGLILVKITADSFLHRMVRMIVGALIEVGSNKISAEEVRKILFEKDKEKAGVAVPPQGLFLTKITYH